jgi:hypothetical protein
VSEGPQEPSFADVLNGFSGSSGPRRRSDRRGLFRRRKDDEPEATGEATSTGGHARPEPGYNSAVDSATDPSGLDMSGLAGDAARPAHGPTDPGPDLSVESGDAASIVRPYAWTGGRTRPTYDLAIETLVSTSPSGREAGAVRQYEHQAVAELCREPRSVAEIAALLRLPLGVARVVIGDMASQGTVQVHQTATASGDVPDMALMERVLSGLRRL